MIHRITKHTTLALLLAASVAACDNTAGPGAESSILLSRGGSTAPSLSTAALASFSIDGAPSTAGATLSSVPLGSVSSIQVKIHRVQALPASRDENQDAGWISLEVDPVSGGEFDLMALSEAGVQLARGELEEGTYSSVRLFVESASITFSSPVTIGAGPMARTYEAGEAYPLTIPSSKQTGIKVPTAGFVVTETTGDVVTLVFDAGVSVQAVQALPTGVQMSPVLTARSN
jgi:hypothetical protein